MTRGVKISLLSATREGWKTREGLTRKKGFSRKRGDNGEHLSEQVVAAPGEIQAGEKSMTLGGDPEQHLKMKDI